MNSKMVSYFGAKFKKRSWWPQWKAMKMGRPCVENQAVKWKEE
jgi:hypothetical protein